MGESRHSIRCEAGAGGETSESLPVFSPAQSQSCFIDDFRCWAREDARNPPPPGAVLCIGSSSMRGWSTLVEDLTPVPVIQRGFGGSEMSDLLLFRDFFLRYQAARVLIYQGDNDLARAPITVLEFVEQCRQFTDTVFAARADTEIYFISIKPSIKRISCLDLFVEGNAELKKLCSLDRRLTMIDVFTPMLNASGEPKRELFTADNLHMNAEGYAIWTRAVRQALALD